MVCIHATRELGMAIFLVAAKTWMISVIMVDLSKNGSFETPATLGFSPGGHDPDRGARVRLVERNLMLRRS
jgi:hypothetical protein